MAPAVGDPEGVIATATAVREGELSAAESVAAAVARVEAATAELSFLVAERFEAALAEAAGADPAAPLAGVAVLVKDANATVAGLPLSEGSRFVRDWVAERDSEYVARLKRAGAIVLGTTTSAEFAEVTACEPHRYGPTGNPRAPGRTTGGSSGGAAAAVAAAAVPLAHGSDAGGSIRIPAACCGLVGLKPTRGRTPVSVDAACADACLWVEHVLTRSVADSALLLDLTAEASGPGAAPAAGRFLAAATGPARPVRVGVATAMPGGAPLHPECAAAVDRAVAVLEEGGNELVEAAPRLESAAAEDAYFTLFAAGMATRVAAWSARLGREPREEELEPYTRYLLERGRACSPADVAVARACLDGFARQVSSFYESFDLWLSPTLAMPPFELGYLDAGPGLDVETALARDGEFTAFTWPANVTGQPAISLPLHETAAGLPVGAQLSGRFGDEETLIAVAAAIERQEP